MQQEVTNKLSSLLQGKVAVADTSSLLIAGTQLLTNISECELVIPAVVVQEIEGKRNHPTLGVLARQWINLIEELRVLHKAKLAKGVPIADSTVTLKLEPNHTNQGSLPAHLQNGSNDSTVLAVAANLDQDPKIIPPVVLLSNDIPMRIHATLHLELDAYEFSSTSLSDDRAYTARAKVVLSPEEFVELDLSEAHNLSKLEKVLKEKASSPVGHHMLIDVYLTGEKDATYTFRLEEGKLKKIERKVEASHIFGKTLEQDVAMKYLATPASELPIVSIGGSAGTGKTLITVATALSALKNREYQKIVVFRSLHEMGQGQEMGFLPGDVNSKMDAWAGAVMDSLDVIAFTKKPLKKNEGPAAVENRKKVAEELRAMIEVSPITYLRGRSLSNAFIILDEAQNFSRTELLNIVSRVGENSKLVLLFDAQQVDNRFLQAGARADIWSVIKTFRSEELFAHVTLTRTERSRVAELASRALESEVHG